MSESPLVNSNGIVHPPNVSRAGGWNFGGAAVGGGGFGVDAVTVAERGVLHDLAVVHGTGNTRDGAVDATEPHTARVDSGDQGVGIHLSDVTFDH